MKIAILSDFDPRGSGYRNIAIPLCQGLVKLGHEIKAVGLGYDGSEHNFNFSIIPVNQIKDSLAVANNLANLWGTQAFIIAMDIPVQEQILQSVQGVTDKIINIFPIEADPLCFTWAQLIAGMRMPYIISEFGTAEALKAGIKANYLEVGVDTKSWRRPTKEERKSLRTSFNFTDESFVILTVADNQERKHLSRSIEMFAEFQKDKPEAYYILVTREHNYVGWKLRDYFQELKVPSSKYMIIERGTSFQQLWSIYAMADLFLLTSKAEGLGMPILEAMAVGVPVAGTNCTSIGELIADGRGLPIKYDYVYRDPFGNGKRYFASLEDGVRVLNDAFDFGTGDVVDNAFAYVKKRSWDKTSKKFSKKLIDTFEKKEGEDGEEETTQLPKESA